jgi:hypothetical protein
MGTTALVALISGSSAVFGALIGSGSTLLVARRAEATQHRRDHDDAILSFWTAVASFGSLWSALAEVLPADSNAIEKFLQGLQLGSYGRLLVERQFSVADAVWHAMGRVRMVATASELRVASSVEKAIGEWRFGYPMPDSFGEALRELRLLVEGLGPEGAAIGAQDTLVRHSS